MAITKTHQNQLAFGKCKEMVIFSRGGGKIKAISKITNRIPAISLYRNTQP